MEIRVGVGRVAGLRESLWLERGRGGGIVVYKPLVLAYLRWFRRPLDRPATCW